MRLLARIGIARKVFDDAELLLAAVLELAPDYRAARQEYAEVLIEAAQVQRGAPRARAAAWQAIPENRDCCGRCTPRRCVGLGEHRTGHRTLPGAARRDAARRGLASVDRACAEDSRPAPAGDRLLPPRRRTAGRISAMPTGAWRTSRPTGSRTRSSRTCAPRKQRRPPRSVDRYHLCFALGKALEDQGDYAESFRYYERGNALKRSESRYRPEIIENNTRQQIEVCTTGVLREPRRLRRAGS